ncbi:MAG: hypothetical protein ABI581_08265, partial [Sediminibacterium sp.]
RQAKSHQIMFTQPPKNYILGLVVSALVVSIAAAFAESAEAAAFRLSATLAESAAVVLFSPELQAAKAPRANTNNSFFIFCLFCL